MKIQPGSLRPDGTLWAQGPARVPEDCDMPPIDWGNARFGMWKSRVAAWRARPAKERLGCKAPRQRADPNMPIVVNGSVVSLRWSNGAGVWSYGTTNYCCSKRGYWAKQNYYEAPVPVGDTVEDVVEFFDKVVAAQIALHTRLIESLPIKYQGIIKSVEDFEHFVLGPQVLDTLADLDAICDETASRP